MTAPDTAEFERRHARWAELQRDMGPIRSFSYAWRLPDLARRAGGDARFRAALALAQTLVAMGRHGEALAALPNATETPPPALAARLLYCRACALAATDIESARACFSAALPHWPDRLVALAATAHFAFVSDTPDPEAGDAYLAAAHRARNEEHLARASLLGEWARPDSVAPTEIHGGIAWLRQHVPSETAAAETLHAEARFRVAPAEALVWLDHALALGERYGWHQFKARLLGRKALSLEAAGRLADARRFREYAINSAITQGIDLGIEL